MVGHLNLYAHVQQRHFTATEPDAFRDALRQALGAYWSVKVPIDVGAFALAV
jgi:hypothetical protein